MAKVNQFLNNGASTSSFLMHEQSNVRSSEKIKPSKPTYEKPSFLIQEIDESMNSGFKSIPDDSSVEDIRALLFK